MTRYTQHKHTELIFGVHPILELLQAKKRKLHILYTTKPTPKSFAQIEKFLPKGLQMQYVKRDVLNKLAGTTDHQGIVGYAGPFQIRKKFFDPATQPFLVMLDGVQDTGNLGAILRSAYCTGVDGVILVKRGSAPITASVIKASAGLAEHLDILMVSSAAAGALELKKAGYNVYLSFVGKAQDATKVAYTKPLCVVIGSEATGISSEIVKSGTLITLPQRTPNISYNASVAAGILLFLIADRIHAF